MTSDRDLLKCDWWTQFDQIATDQQAGMPRPDVQKDAPPDAERVDLIPPNKFTIGDTSLFSLMEKRRSHRFFSDAPLDGLR